MTSAEHKPVYSRNRFPKQIAKGTCRGCHGVITDPRRRTWCGDPCKKKYDPYWVKKAVIARDKHICQLCGRDMGEERRQWRRMKPNWFTATSSALRAWARAKPREEYDHIIPFSEGGPTLVENMRTLCTACHKQRTKEWRAAKKATVTK